MANNFPNNSIEIRDQAESNYLATVARLSAENQIYWDNFFRTPSPIALPDSSHYSTHQYLRHES